MNKMLTVECNFVEIQRISLNLNKNIYSKILNCKKKMKSHICSLNCCTLHFITFREPFGHLCIYLIGKIIEIDKTTGANNIIGHKHKMLCLRAII